MSASLTQSANAANVFSSLGGIVSGVGGIVSSKQQEQQGNYNAAIYEQQAQAARTSQSLLEAQKRKIIKSTIGSQVAAVGKSGLRYSGSPIEVALDSLTNAELDIHIDRYNSEVQARGYESSAAMSRWEGRQTASKTKVDAGGKLFSTGASLYSSQREIGLGGKK